MQEKLPENSSLVEEWKGKKEKNPSALKFKQRKKMATPSLKLLGGGMSDPEYTYHADPSPGKDTKNREIYHATIAKATGTLNEALGIHFLSQACSATTYGNQISTVAEAVSAALLEMQPADPIEGMLVTQLVAIHNQIMEFMKRSVRDNVYDRETDLNINRYTKLNQRFLNTLECLLKYRKRGDQTMHVENLTINHDGKAIIGNFNPQK